MAAKNPDEYPPIRKFGRDGSLHRPAVDQKLSRRRYKLQRNQKHPSSRPKRTTAERERDLGQISELYLKGHSHARIAEYISSQRPYDLSRQAIDQDIMEIHKRWLHAQLVNFDDAKARELSKIDRLEQAYWEGWEQSRQEQVQTTTQKTEDNSLAIRDPQAKTFTRATAKSIKKSRDGNEKFLEGVLKCVQERCKIIGLYAPDKLDINWREEARIQGFDPDQVEADLVAQFQRAAAVPRDPNSP